MRRRVSFRSSTLKWVSLMAAAVSFGLMVQAVRSQSTNNPSATKDATADNAVQLVTQGRQIFRFDTFGDQAFWGDTLKLHLAIEGCNHGAVGAGVSPSTALPVGLKVD